MKVFIFGSCRVWNIFESIDFINIQNKNYRTLMHSIGQYNQEIDFVNNKSSSTLPNSSYLPGTVSRNLNEILPNYVAKSLQGAMKAFGKKMNGYYSNEAILLATESRTSSPVRIPRNKETFEHIQIKGLYPCAEGAGYAGGIVSAAMDGENCAKAIGMSLG